MTLIISKQKFEIDTEGFKRHMAGVKPHRIVQEIIANSFDEDSVKQISCEITQVSNSIVKVVVVDDGIGFEDINDVYTMYKHSKKRSKTDKRGKFNLGEKQFFVLAESGYVKTKNQHVVFSSNGRFMDTIDYPRGTIVCGEFKWNGGELRDLLLKLHQIIVPNGKKLLINDVPVIPKTLVKKIKFDLMTEIEDESKVLRRVKKTTDVCLYKISENEKPILYELGVPVQKLEHSIEWHIDVQQKIPVPVSRDVVSEAYLSDLYAGIINNATDLITEENAGSKFVTVAMSKAEPEVAKEIFVKHLGTDKIYIPSTKDYQANESVLGEGGKLLEAKFFDRETRQHLKDIGVLKLATDDFASTFCKKCDVINPDEKMEFNTKVVKAIAYDVLKKDISVEYVDSDSSHGAWYGNGKLTFNVTALGKKHFDVYSPYPVGLIIHELSHDKERGQGENVPHYTKEFVSELERIGGIVGSKGISYYVNLANHIVLENKNG